MVDFKHVSKYVTTFVVGQFGGLVARASYWSIYTHILELRVAQNGNRIISIYYFNICETVKGVTTIKPWSE